MTWFRVDDGFGEHAKVDALGADLPIALSVWLLCGCGSARALTDGRVTSAALVRHCALMPTAQRIRGAQALVRVGLWHEAEDGDGWVFHGWDDHQPTRADVKRAQEQGRARKDAWRERKRAERGTPPEREGNGVPPASPERSQNIAPTRPDPTRPEGEGESASAAFADEPAVPAAPRKAPQSLERRKLQRTLAASMRTHIEAAARAANTRPPIECSEPDHRVWLGCADSAIETAEMRGLDPEAVLQLAAEEAVLDMPRRAWKVRHLVEDFVELVSATHIERRAKARASRGAA